MADDKQKGRSETSDVLEQVPAHGADATDDAGAADTGEQPEGPGDEAGGDLEGGRGQ
jgi:hypothetical protein